VCDLRVLRPPNDKPAGAVHPRPEAKVIERRPVTLAPGGERIVATPELGWRHYSFHRLFDAALR